MSPLANAYLPAERVERDGAVLPAARARLRELLPRAARGVRDAASEIFSDYAYFSSYSTSWLEHSRRYAEQMIERFGLGRRQPGRRDRLQRRLPAAVLPRAPDPRARRRAGRERRRGRRREGHPDRSSSSSARSRGAGSPRRAAADLLLGNNVLAHVPDLNDFVAGMKILLKPGGVITMEFPHLMRLIEDNQFDTIYHEHFSYFSFLTVSARLRRARAAAVRRRGAADPRRLAARSTARHADDPDKPESARRARAAPSASATAGSSGSRPTAATAGASSRTSADPALPDRAEGAGPADRRLRRAGEGQHAAQLLRHADATSSTTRATSTRTSRASSCRAATSRSARPTQLREDRPDVVLILPWNLKDEIMRAARASSASGAGASPRARRS